jgi:hypothetical protein
MAQTFNRICLEDYPLVDEDDPTLTFTLKRGKEYITSPERDGQVRVYSTYWVWVPATLFAGAKEFTPALKAERR